MMKENMMKKRNPNGHHPRSILNPMNAKVLYLSPMVPSRDLDQTVRFFVELLGFQLTFSSPTYRICTKDNLTVHFLPAGPDIGQMEFYIEVDDVDAVWESVRDRLGEVRHKPPHDREYAMREMHIDIPATDCLVFIGQSLT